MDEQEKQARARIIKSADDADGRRAERRWKSLAYLAGEELFAKHRDFLASYREYSLQETSAPCEELLQDTAYLAVATIHYTQPEYEEYFDFSHPLDMVYLSRIHAEEN